MEIQQNYYSVSLNGNSAELLFSYSFSLNGNSAELLFSYLNGNSAEIFLVILII